MKKILEMWGVGGTIIFTVSVIGIIILLTLPEEEIKFTQYERSYRTEVWESNISKMPLWEDITEKREFAIAEAERIEAERLEQERLEQERIEQEQREAEERESRVWTAIYNYTSNGTTQSYIYYAWQQFPYYGWSAYDLECLITLWHRESEWNPLSHNPSSGAHGIPQSLPADKMARFGADYWDNGYTQIEWGLWYIWQRYGTPANALSHSYAVGWY